MRISTFAFQKLHDEFLEKIKLYELSPDDLIGGAIREEYIWSCKRVGTSRKFMDIIFKGSVKSDTYFFDKRYRESPTAQQCFINDMVMITTLQYLGYVVPSLIINIHALNKSGRLGSEDKAKILYQYFIEDNLEDEIAQNRDRLFVYDLNTNKLIIDAMKSPSTLAGSTSIGNVSTDPHEIEKKKIAEIISQFYLNVAHPEKLELAWNTISNYTKEEKWGTDFDKFKSGYKNTIAITNLHIWNIQIVNDFANCKVFYEDEVKVRTSSELANINTVTLGDLDVLLNQLNRIKSKAENLNDFQEIEVCRLFSKTASEYIWYKTGADFDALKKVLPTPEEISVPRLVGILLEKIQGQWLLKNFRALAAYPLT